MVIRSIRLQDKRFSILKQIGAEINTGDQHRRSTQGITGSPSNLLTVGADVSANGPATVLPSDIKTCPVNASNDGLTAVF